MRVGEEEGLHDGNEGIYILFSCDGVSFGYQDIRMYVNDLACHCHVISM